MNDKTNAIQTYLKGVRAEWGKVSWPEKRQVVIQTFFVIAIATVFTIAIYLMDIIFKGMLGFLK